MKSTDIVVFGSAIVDFICYCPRLPKTGETLHGSKFCTGFGGKGANQCVAAAKMGAKCAMVAKVGDDQWGRDYLANLNKEKVNTEFVESLPGETTGVAAINVSDNGDNQIVIVTGANKNLSVESFKDALKKLADAKILICQLETPINETVEALKLFKGISILNAAPAIENPSKDLITSSSVLCVNETEASLMTGIQVQSTQDAKNAINRLKDLGAKTVILTMGEQGAVYSEANSQNVYHVPTKKVDKVVDTTGAGDAFIGALAFFLAKHPNRTLAQSIGAACEVASTSVQSPGTQSSFPHASDIENLQLEVKEYLCIDL